MVPQARPFPEHPPRPAGSGWRSLHGAHVLGRLWTVNGRSFSDRDIYDLNEDLRADDRFSDDEQQVIEWANAGANLEGGAR